MDDLPDEMLQMIFTYLTLEERIYKVKLVCQRWKFLVDTMSHWNSFLYTVDSTLKNIDHARILKNMPSLKSLCVKDISSPETMNVLFEYPPRQLRYLKLIYFGYDSALAEHLLSNNVNSLERLEISDRLFSRVSVANILSACNKLENLHIQMENPMIEKCDASLRIVAVGICPIKSFRFVRCNFSTSCLKYFLEKKGQLIEKLILDRETLMMIQFIEMLELETSVQETKYMEYSWMHFALCHGYLSSLRVFEIVSGGYGFENTCLVRLLLEKCPTLRHLKLPQLFIATDNDLKPAQNCNDLTTLELDGSFKTTVQSLKHLCYCKNLQTLNLYVKEMNARGEDYLLRMKSLQILKIPRVRPSNNFFLKFREKLVNLRELIAFKLVWKYPVSVHNKTLLS